MQICEKSKNKSEVSFKNTRKVRGFSPDSDFGETPLPTGERSPLRGDLFPGRSFGYSTILALDLGTTTGWALRNGDGLIISGWQSFKPQRFEGGGMRYLRFKHWLTELKNTSGNIDQVYFEEVRGHRGVDAAHAYGGFMGQLTAWCEHHSIAYLGVPVATIKQFITGKGNAAKDQVITAVKALGHEVEDDNEADALALLHLALHQLGGAI